MEYLEIGQIVNTQGLKGEVKIYPFTDDITRFDVLKKIYIEINNGKVKLDIEKVRYAKNMVICKFKKFDSLNDVEQYKGKYIFIDEEDKLELPDNTYYISDIINCDVFDASEKRMIGKITDVFSTKANDVYEVTLVEGRKVYIPSIKKVIDLIDIENKKIYINLIEGLL